MANLHINSSSFSEIVLSLQEFWRSKGCSILAPYDIPAGAGTFHPATLLKALSKKPWSVAYLAPSRRPADGRYGDNPNRLGAYHQFQVLIKPNPENIQELYLKSLEFIGLDLSKHDIRFVEDNWESPTLGASGLGWEVWLDGMEITQFTYFQYVGSIACESIPIEITYGLERLVSYIQGVDNVFDIKFGEMLGNDVSYGDIFMQSEREFSKYNFEIADVNMLLQSFENFKKEALNCIENKLVLPAYDCVIYCSHFFNILDARRAISVSSRAQFILEIRELAKKCALLYIENENEEKNT
ncbi:MAG: glycine--tRNA ligase subunit alpha [Helicobacter sp.]|nr:glycine--tRNA ligase subunit alpha [Helicobacter sp.]